MASILPTVSINTDSKSPYYFASFTGADGRQKRRSTKVPVNDGLWQGRNISAKQAQAIALRVAAELAQAEREQYHAKDNTTMCTLCHTMLSGKLGRVSLATHENARADYNQFLAWLGTRADMRSWALARRAEVRHGTVRKALTAIRAAFAWAVDSGIIPTNPSAEFTQLVRLHGIGLIGKGAGGHRRAWHSKTFHSLRAAAVKLPTLSC